MRSLSIIIIFIWIVSQDIIKLNCAENSQFDFWVQTQIKTLDSGSIKFSTEYLTHKKFDIFKFDSKTWIWSVRLKIQIGKIYKLYKY